jgi:hypothetical protein
MTHVVLVKQANAGFEGGSLNVLAGATTVGIE